METLDCPFCNPSENRIVLSNDLAYARWDNYPVADGHLLLVPFRHVPDYFDATAGEKEALWRLLDQSYPLIQQRFTPDGVNVGVNVGQAAGQTVFHLHIHVIPRYVGDVPEPRGGVRGVIPEKKSY